MRKKSYKFSNKRGVSPLIATILLISFTVALGSVVLNWGRNLDIAKPGDVCFGVAIKMRNIGDAEACYTGSGSNTYINFIIDNTGNVNIDGFGVWITGDKGTKLLDFDNMFVEKKQLLDIKDNSVVYDSNKYGPIKSIQFFPKIKSTGSLEICARNSVKVSNIKEC